MSKRVDTSDVGISNATRLVLAMFTVGIIAIVLMAIFGGG